ncbi:polysaccharide deacetylase family sporulation protein PdaB [Anaerobacillus isosaccharinicus]|uniref:Polysaccharide deacetylase family sporulation protein PdaB n=1 Tax=Anaerobacillus isosaccharinicus TaxID=1532552 RepID=A0A1S2MGL5_9BACI|nr:polysaccharide deacetylase family sporulation protein PdaB [Anaerobacillus isosaccharinicus]MBA5584012.1 polysaccharide deacetylase family sporulation protein PdaB [Anaerobacillus isosaccharinicus]QOY37572.1 polysaccharide deacetylase family sporulation protein PdaB [Anaerobacillus isosaccharinicus]
MNFIWIWNGKKIKQYMIVVVAAFFTAGVLYVERSQITVFSPSAEATAIYKAETSEKKIALTFNISWGEEKAIPILDILKDEEINNATFFLSASWAERHPDIVERIVKDGHEIGSHGYRYENYPQWEDEKVRKDIQRAHQTLYELTNKAPKLLRPPNGNFDKRVLKIAEAQKYKLIHWSIDSKDYGNPGVEQIISNVMDNVTGGDIVLFHASDRVKQTHKALPTIIDHLKDKGYEFVSVSELITSTEADSSEIK